MELIDTHCHLTFEELENDILGVIGRSVAAGVTGWVTVGTKRGEIEKVISLADRYDNMYAGLGYHPHYAKDVTDDDLAALKDAAGNPKVVAVGETGLDYHYNYALYETQRTVFRTYLKTAKEANKPVVIHSRESFTDTFDIVRQFAPLDGVVHCFSYSLAEAEAFLSLGLHISFCGQITFKKCDELRDVAREIPLDKLLLETDCPYLSPAPLRGKRNEPANVKIIAEKHAEIRGINIDELIKRTDENAVRLFRLGG